MWEKTAVNAVNEILYFTVSRSRNFGFEYLEYSRKMILLNKIYPLFDTYQPKNE